MDCYYAILIIFILKENPLTYPEWKIIMKTGPITSIILLLILSVTGCRDSTSARIKESLIDYATKKNTALKSLRIDSITYTLSDSTVYYNHFLISLAERSESFSKMARLKTNLAQSHINTFLSETGKDNYSAERNKTDVDKSLEALQQNEREWNVINDSMDVMLNAIHNTDTLNKVFYNVRFSLNAIKENKKMVQNSKAILKKDDFSVVIFD